MKRRTWFGALAIALGATLSAGGLYAGNMAFKLNYRLNTAGGGISALGKNTLSLPYFRRAGLNTAENLGQELGGRTVVPSIARYLEAIDGFCVYIPQPRIGGTPCANFSLVAGEGLFLSMASSRDYIIVGAHDPSLVISLDTTTPGISARGKNFVALPYNISSTNALQLMQDIGGGGIAPVASVAKYNVLTDGWIVYTGRMGSPASAFQLRQGEAYFISMNATVPWTPSHY
jgi:hypothetical protein